MEKWRNGEKEKWKNGEIEKWRNGEMEKKKKRRWVRFHGCLPISGAIT